MTARTSRCCSVMLPRASMTSIPNSSHELIVLVEHLALEQPEAFDRVGAPAEIHARLVELQLHAAGHQPVDRHIDRHAEVQREIGPDRKAVELAHPLPIDAARRVARECRVGIAVASTIMPALSGGMIL